LQEDLEVPVVKVEIVDMGEVELVVEVLEVVKLVVCSVLAGHLEDLEVRVAEKVVVVMLEEVV
jgi:hypothetical protein